MKVNYVILRGERRERVRVRERRLEERGEG